MAKHFGHDCARSWRRYIRPALRFTLVHLMLVAIGAVIMVPFLWTLTTSVKPAGAGIRFPPELFPKQIVWANYPKVFETIPFMRYFRNSVIVAGLAVVGELLSASLVAYSFARLRFPGRGMLFSLVLATMMVPYPVTLVPTFILFKNLGFLETFLPLVLPPYFGPAFSIFLLRQFFLTVNPELSEAACVDGAGQLRTYWQIVLPLCKPALATVGIFSFMGYWNDFMSPLIYLSDEARFTLAVGITYLRSFRGHEITLEMAGAVLFMLPCILLFFLAQRYIVEGIVTTGIKG